MPRYVAFLRAINVGGHTAKMGELISVVEALGLTEVESFLASGNLIFTAGKAAPSTLEKKISTALEAKLGFEVATFLRTDREVAEVVKNQPFAESLFKKSQAFNVGFLAEPLDRKGVEVVEGFTTKDDDFQVEGREVYWLCRTKQSESRFNAGKLERTLGKSITFRSRSSLTKLATKYGWV
jgi:uncharacterized protein (DUF1697 family)